ncbi:hypothetical protein DPMN_125322 [Dreissena polymorpha]|uniref:Uncharacterized protein n=1 Tax=Dreissena polymorpha TaxID=45954 RepID=A0A9D4GTR6_DREPO|nr:hypothetical protein DPMN_125322 [Dreissena polymorpha]
MRSLTCHSDCPATMARSYDTSTLSMRTPYPSCRSTMRMSAPASTAYTMSRTLPVITVPSWVCE